MPERSDKASESVARRHDHSERGHDTSREQSQAPIAPEYGVDTPELMGSAPSGITAGDGGVSLQRSHAKMLGDVGLGRSINAQRRINMYLQLQRTYGNAHVQQVQRLIREHRTPGEDAAQTNG